MFSLTRSIALALSAAAVLATTAHAQSTKVSSVAMAPTSVHALPAQSVVSGVEWRAPADTVASDSDDTSETGPINYSWTAAAPTATMSAPAASVKDVATR